MNLTHNQKAGLRMLARGFKPRHATLEALQRHGLVEGPRHRPTLTPLGREAERIGDLP